MIRKKKQTLTCILFLAIGNVALPSNADAGPEFTAGGEPIKPVVLSVQPTFYVDRTEYKIDARLILGSHIKDFTTTVIWTPASSARGVVEEQTTVAGSGKTGKLTANCPADPVIFSDQCTGALFNGIYADPYLQNIKGQLISRNILTNEHKASLRLQSEVGTSPVILKPTPNQVYGDEYRMSDGKTYRVPIIVTLQYEADISLEIKKFQSSSFEGSVQISQRGFPSESADTTSAGHLFSFELELEPGFYKINARVGGVESTRIKSSEQVQFSVLGSVDAEQLGKALAEDTNKPLPIDKEEAIAGAPGELSPEKTSDTNTKEHPVGQKQPAQLGQAMKIGKQASDGAFNPQPEPPAKSKILIASDGDHTVDQGQLDIGQRSGDIPPANDAKEHISRESSSVVQKLPEGSVPKHVSPTAFLTVVPVEGRVYNAAMPVFIKTISPIQTEVEFKLTRLADPENNIPGKVVEQWSVEEMQPTGSGNFVYDTSKRLTPGDYLLAVGVQDGNALNYNKLPHRRFSVADKPMPIGAVLSSGGGQASTGPGSDSQLNTIQPTAKRGMEPLDRPVPVKKGMEPLDRPAPVKKGMEPLDRPAPTLVALPRGVAFSANSLTSLPVKHVAGQKPIYEFDYYDGRAWRKDRSIRPISTQTPHVSGTSQVISKTSFRIAKPGKYRYRVKTDAPGALFSPYQEFVVIDPQATRRMAQASAQSSRAKAAAEQPSAAGAPQSKMNIAKSPTKASKSSPPANSADLLQGKDSASPQVKAQRQLMPPSTPPKITFPRPNQSFSTPANVMIKTSHDSRFDLVFELSKDTGKFLKAKSGDLRKLSIGKYRVKVGYEGKSQRSQVDFVVKLPIKKQAVQAQSQPQKAPTTQPTQATPSPIRRPVSPQ